MKEVYLLDPPRVNFYWPQIEEVLEDIPGFLDFYTPEWAFEQIKMGHLHVWALDDGVIRGIVISRIAEYPRQKVFEIVAVAGIGMLDFFSEMESTFMKLAKACGCKSFSATARPGIARLLKKQGAWTEAHRLIRPVVVEMEH